MVLVKPQCQTSVTKSGTDGSPELAGIQGTKWHSTTGPDGPMRFLPFLLVKRRKTEKQKKSQKLQWLHTREEKNMQKKLKEASFHLLFKALFILKEAKTAPPLNI